MLASLLARYHRPGAHEMDRYAAWSAALQRLRVEWSEGKRPAADDLASYLDDVPAAQRIGAMHDLVAEHLRLSWKDGRGLRLEAYPIGEAPVDLVEDELIARYQPPHGDAPPLDEYQKRFASRPEVIEAIGRRFLDGERYVKLHKRGHGAIGEVWEAWDRRLCRLVAIKQPRADLPNASEALRHFAREAAVTAGLEHPGIVPVHEFREADGSAPFYVMRLIDGRTLAECIADFHRPPLDRTPVEQRLLWRQLIGHFLDTCDAVTHAHRRGVLHRDLKPGNIIVGDCGGTVILDWGNDSVAGTPEYMAPEQAGGVTDARSDLFGLGAILYEILTGRSLYGWIDGARPRDWRRLVGEAAIERPRSVNPGAPRAWEAICLKATARVPSDRYQNAEELTRDVRACIAGEPISVLPEPLWRRLGRRLGRVLSESEYRE